MEWPSRTEDGVTLHRGDLFEKSSLPQPGQRGTPLGEALIERPHGGFEISSGSGARQFQGGVVPCGSPFGGVAADEQ